MMIGNFVSYHHTPSMVAKSAYFYVQDIGHYGCDAEYYTKREGYHSFLLIYTVSGSGRARYRDREYELKPGQALLMNCYEYQEYSTGKNGFWEIKWIHFYGSTSEEYFNIIYNKHGAVIDLSECNVIETILDEILRLADKSSFLPEAKAALLITQLLTELLLEDGDVSENVNSRPLNEHVQKALDYVENHYSEDISISDLAGHSCCSEYHFSRLFKKEIGYSPYEYILKFRINKAKNLLKNTGGTVGEIAEGVGFSSTSNFIRTFRELEGMTPLRYRRYWN